MSYPTFLSRAEREIRDERERQDTKWSEQNHPDGTGGEAFEFRRDIARIDTDARAKHGDLTWQHILTEEVFEALAEDDPAKLRAELIQVAAVAQAWVETIDRRTAPRAGEPR